MAEITITPQAATPAVTGFDNVPQIGALQDTSKYQDVREINKYEFMRHTYEGDAGYRDCSFLTPGSREMFYEDRRRVSYYVNAFKPIINAMVDECFAKDATRETSNEYFAQFIENCDASGTPLAMFMRNAIRNARIYSVNFIVMENFSAKEMQGKETAEQAIGGRVFPYIYEKGPQQVKAIVTNKQGAVESITFCDEMIVIDKKDVQTYRRWDAQSWQLFYLKKSDGKEVEVIIDEGTHGLGVIPVIYITDFAKSASLKELPDPEFYDIAFLCFGLFNKESQVCWMEIMQTFAILCTSGMGTNAKAIGPATFLDSGTDSKYPPQYVAPPQDGIRTLIDNCQRLKDEIKDQAKQKGVIGVKNADSGIAKEWDFRAEEAILKQTALACERVEKALAEVFALYVRAAVSYEVAYPKDYSPIADKNKVDQGLLILKETPPKTLESAIWKSIAGVYFKGQDETLKEIEDALDADLEERTVITDMMGKDAADTEELVIE